MNKKIFIVGFLLVAIFLSGFSSPCQATQQSALDNAILVIRSISSQFGGLITWRTNANDFKSVYLRTGESYTYQNYFYKNTSYFIAAVGCDDAKDIDIALFDENGREVDKDISTNNWGMVKVTPRWSGSFIVKVVMYAAAGGGAHVITLTGFAN